MTDVQRWQRRAARILLSVVPANSHGVWGRCGRKYLHIIGITRREVHDIRKNLLVPSEDEDNPDLLSTFSMGSREVDGTSPALDQISKVGSEGGPMQHTAQAASRHPPRTGTSCRNCTQQYKGVSHKRGQAFCPTNKARKCPASALGFIQCRVYMSRSCPPGHALLDAACLWRKVCGCHPDRPLRRTALCAAA